MHIEVDFAAGGDRLHVHCRDSAGVAVLAYPHARTGAEQSRVGDAATVLSVYQRRAFNDLTLGCRFEEKEFLKIEVEFVRDICREW